MISKTILTAAAMLALALAACGDNATSQVCGDTLLGANEQCDDGNTTSGDGCDSTCHVEKGYTCSGAPSACAITCGDGVLGG